MIRKFTFLLFLFFHLSINAQNIFPITTIDVKVNNKLLINPWAGGMNNPEFSSINLNRDTFNDIFIFDKDGYKINTFVNLGNADTPLFLYSPKYHKNFPELTKLALIRDYDQDGVDDIYSSASSGLKLLKGTYHGGSDYSYQVIDSPLVFYTAGFEVNVYNANDDIPAIRDMDGDGDLDILVNSIFGQSYEFYKNKSVELYGHVDTSTYEIANTCWGHFLEDPFNNNLLLGACKSDNIVSNANDTIGSYRHSGCTIELIDQDNDGDVEILLGDPGFSTIVYGENGGTSSAANMTFRDTIFPLYSKKIDIPIFPASFSLDVNNDHKNDLIFAPNIEQTSLDIGNVWYYKNVGPDNDQQFIFQTDSFLVGDMIDVGKNSKPLFFDYNNDSLVDILVSNAGYFNRNTNLNDTKLSLFKNIGTVDTPKYELLTRDYQNLFALGLKEMKHTLGDLDGDGDKDMVIGDFDGQLHYFQNIPTAGIANFTSVAPIINMFGLDAGQRANPCLHDIDKDGDLDLLVGRLDGKISYYWNFGSPTIYKFNMDSVNNDFGNIDVTNPYSHPDGNSCVFVKDSIIYVGSQYGVIQEFLINSDSLRKGTLSNILYQLGNIRDGYNSTLDIADLNRDGIVEYMIGNSRGGITMYSDADWDTIIPSRYILGFQEPISQKLNIQIYPNPANEQVNIYCDFYDQLKTNLKIYNLKGQLIYNKKLTEINTSISVKEFEAGMYIIRLENEKTLLTKKLIINR